MLGPMKFVGLANYEFLLTKAITFAMQF